MSLATLSKKTKTLYHSMSVNRPQFSLNGVYRNDRSTSIITNRIQTSVPRTLARGNSLRGFGGDQGTFKITNITPLCEQPMVEQIPKKIIKVSSISNTGVIATKYRWTRLPNPQTWVKRSNSNINNSQTRTENLTRQATGTIIDTISNAKCQPNSNCVISTKNGKYKTYNLTKDKTTFIADSQGNYIARLNGKCVNSIVNTIYNLPTNNIRTPVLGKI